MCDGETGLLCDEELVGEGDSAVSNYAESAIPYPHPNQDLLPHSTAIVRAALTGDRTNNIQNSKNQTPGSHA